MRFLLRAVTLAILCLLCLMAGCGTALYAQLGRFSSWAGATGVAAAEAGGQEAIEQALKRVTPVIIIQPSMEARRSYPPIRLRACPSSQ